LDRDPSQDIADGNANIVRQGGTDNNCDFREIRGNGKENETTKCFTQAKA
jgi:hypothetical protein